LRDLSDAVGRYLDFALRTRSGARRHRFIRELFALAGWTGPALFVQTVERALRYAVTDLETLRRMARLLTSQGQWQVSGVEVDESFSEREAYQQGRLTDLPDFSLYERMLEEQQDEEEEEP
jgi:hypothetical protein